MITSDQFLASAPTYGTAESFLNLLRSMDSSVPQDSTGAPAQPGNVGWQMFGWGNDDLNSKSISSQFFWNQAAGFLGWPQTSLTMQVAPPVLSLPVPPPSVPDQGAVTIVTSTPGASVGSNPLVGPGLPPLTAPTQAQIVTGTPGANLSAAAPAASAGFSLSEIPWWGWALAAGAVYYATKGGR